MLAKVVVALVGSTVAAQADQAVTGNLSVTGEVDISGTSLTLGPTQMDNWPAFGLSYSESSGHFLSMAVGRSDVDWIWLHPNFGNGALTQISMRLDSAHRLTLYHSPLIDDDPGIVLDPSGVSSFTGSISVGGANNVMPNQTLGDPSSILTVALGDARYARIGVGGFNFGSSSSAAGQSATTFGSGNAASGDGSFAVGGSNTASGWISLATGAYNTAAGDVSFVGGQGSHANGGFSFVYGYTSSANGNGSIALGDSVTAGLPGVASQANVALGCQSTTGGGTGVVAIGYNVNASGDGAVALGYGASAQTATSFAAGGWTAASHPYAVALGGLTISDNIGAFATGVDSAAHGGYAFAAGHGTIAQGYAQAVFGEYNIAQGDSVYVPDDSLFILGNGTDASHRSNALVVKRTGDTEISGKVTADTDVSVAGKLAVAGAVRFDGLVRIAPQGDIGMGDFTHEPGQ